LLHEIANESDLTPDKRNSFQEELRSNGEQLKQFLGDQSDPLKKIGAFYLDGLTDTEIDELVSELPVGLFVREKTAFNKLLDEQVKAFKQAQAKTKLKGFWKEKTGAKTPISWSNEHKTPILCLVPESDFESAKKAFEAINRQNPDAAEIDFATHFLENALFLADLDNKKKRDEAFKRAVMADLTAMLPDADTVRDYLDEKVSLEPYHWYPNPSVTQKLKELAEARYNAGGSDIAIKRIDSMDDKTLKQYLKRLVKDNMVVGIEIITSDGNWDE
jgi:tetratricopeptide (TPR) repeat protein